MFLSNEPGVNFLTSTTDKIVDRSDVAWQSRTGHKRWKQFLSAHTRPYNAYSVGSQSRCHEKTQTNAHGETDYLERNWGPSWQPKSYARVKSEQACDVSQPVDLELSSWESGGRSCWTCTDCRFMPWLNSIILSLFHLGLLCYAALAN